MSQDRIPTPDLHIEQLRPVAYSGDTFVQAAHPENDSRADQLIQALGHFNQNLAQMGANMAADRQRKEAEEIQRQKNITMATTPEGRAEIARTGILPDGTKITDAQVLTMAGANVGALSQESIQQSFAGRDLTGVDTDAEIDKIVAPQLKEYEGKTFVLGGYLRQIEETKAWARNLRSRQEVATRKQAVEGTTFEYLSNQVDRWAKPGASAQDLTNGLQSLYSAIAAGHSTLANPDLLDQYRVQKAAMIVDTDPATAKALLNQEIIGADGKPRLALLAQPQFASQVANILERGEVATAKAKVAQGFDQRRRENFERVTHGGDYTAFRDLDIHGKKFTETEQKVQFVADLGASLDAQIAAGRMNLWQKTQEIARYTSRMNIDDPFIKGELEGIEARYSTVDATNDPEFLKDIEGRATAFDAYRASHRQSLKRQLSDKSFGWFEDFDLYKRYVDPSTEGAAEFANRVTNPPKGWHQGIGKYREKVASEVRSKLTGVVFSDSLVSSSAYEAQVTNLASKFVALGMSQGAAVDAATDKVFADRVHFEGDPLFGLEKAGLPDDYQDILKRMTEDYRTKDARGKAYGGTPTFVALDGGVIALRDRDTLAFLEDERGRLIAFDVQHLQEVSARLAKEKADGAIQRAVEENARKQQDRRDFQDGTYLRKKVEGVGKVFRDAKDKGRETNDAIRNGPAEAAKSFGDGIEQGRARGRETDKAVREGLKQFGSDVTDFAGGIVRNVKGLLGD